MVRAVITAVAVAGFLASPPLSSRARADKSPVIVIPTRPGVPVIINGRDASYAIVEGDWGLARPGHMPVTVIGSVPVRPNRYYAPRRPYYPGDGLPPLRGRNEQDSGDRSPPEPAESFSRSWSTHEPVKRVRQVTPAFEEPFEQGRSYDSGAHERAPAADPNGYNPSGLAAPVIVVPQSRRGRP